MSVWLLWQGSRSGSSSPPKDDAKSVPALKQLLNEKETKILQLETEIVRVSSPSDKQQTNFVLMFLFIVACILVKGQRNNGGGGGGGGGGGL